LLVWRLDGAEPYGLLGDLVDVPARRFGGSGLLGMMIDPELGTFKSAD
jgi:hypothetical protein